MIQLKTVVQGYVYCKTQEQKASKIATIMQTDFIDLFEVAKITLPDMPIRNVNFSTNRGINFTDLIASASLQDSEVGEQVSACFDKLCETILEDDVLRKLGSIIQNLPDVRKVEDLYSNKNDNGVRDVLEVCHDELIMIAALQYPHLRNTLLPLALETIRRWI
jgi:hypothetical protein